MPTERIFSRESETLEKKLKKGLRGSGLVDLGGRILTDSTLKKTNTAAANSALILILGELN